MQINLSRLQGEVKGLAGRRRGFVEFDEAEVGAVFVARLVQVRVTLAARCEW